MPKKQNTRASNSASSSNGKVTPKTVNILADFRASIAKEYGRDAIDDPNAPPIQVEAVPTGSLLLDAAMGIGGFPKGRIGEVFGEPQTGKSTLALSVARHVQQLLGKPVLYFDYEQAMATSEEYVRSVGVSTDPDLWFVSRPDHLEAGMAIAEQAIKTNAFGLIIFDSLAAMTSKAEMEAEPGAILVAPQARAMSVALRRLTHIISTSQTIVLIINHVHETIGGYGPSQKTTPGGKAVKFYSTFRVELKRYQSIKGKVIDFATGKPVDGQVAVKVKTVVIKNKVGAPYREGFFYLSGDSGIDEGRMLLDVAEARKLIVREGAWYRLPFADATARVQGQDGVYRYFAEHPQDYAHLYGQVKDLVFGESNVSVAATEADDEGEDDMDVDEFALDSDEIGEVG